MPKLKMEQYLIFLSEIFLQTALFGSFASLCGTGSEG